MRLKVSCACVRACVRAGVRAGVLLFLCLHASLHTPFKLQSATLLHRGGGGGGRATVPLTIFMGLQSDDVSTFEPTSASDVGAAGGLVVLTVRVGA